MLQRRTSIAIGVGAALLVVLVAYLWMLWPTDVEVIPVQRREIVEVVIATGRLEAEETSPLGSDLTGIVREVLVREGDRVERDEVAVELRETDVANRLAQAEARLERAENRLARVRRGPTGPELEAARAEIDAEQAARAEAERQLERVKPLFEAGFESRAALELAETRVAESTARLRGARARLEQLRQQPLVEELRIARAEVREAKAAVDAAEDDVAKTGIRAPFPGLVTEVYVAAGESVSPGTRLLDLAAMEQAEYVVETDEDNLEDIEPGQRAKIFYPAFPGESFEASVRQIGPEIDTERGTVDIHLDPESLPEDAFPGLTVDANIYTARFEDALAIPANSVMKQGGDAWVMVAENGIARRRPVDVLGSGGDWSAVRGLDADALVIRDGAIVSDGTPVSTTRTRPASNIDDDENDSS